MILMEQRNAITIERVRILYEKVFASITTANIAAFIFAYIFREQIASSVLIIWLSYMVVVNLYRYWLLFDYKKTRLNNPCHDKYEKRFAYSTWVLGIGWAFCIVWGLTLPAAEYRIYSLLWLVAFVTVALPVFSSSIKIYYLYVAPTLIISIPLLLFRGGDDTVLGIALIVFTVMMVRSSRGIYNTLNDALVLRNQAQHQADTLKKLRHEKSETEQRMLSIMNHTPAVIYAKDRGGRYIFINQKWEQLFDKKRKGIIGKTDHEIFPQEFAEKFTQNDKAVLTSGHAMESEEVAPHDDGPHTYVTVKFPLFDEEDNLYAVAGVSTDITERTHIEESLRISQQRLLLHREQSPVGIIEWNTNFEPMDWNPAAERIFGYTKEEALGCRITERILPEGVLQEVTKIWEELLNNEGGAYSLNENITKDGRTILCEWHNTPLIDQHGKIIGVTSLVDDVTERQKNEESLRHSQKMDAIGNLTGGIAHDFNNMLNVILGFSDLLKERLSSDDPKLIKYNNEVINASERARKLTSKLLFFSRKMPASSEMADINQLLNGMKHLLERTLTPRIKLVFELEENLWPVWLDQARLEDAILNTGINAMHAMPDGGTLTLSTGNMHLADSEAQNIGVISGEYVLLSVSDTGIGMSRDVQEKMFDPFFTTKGTGGTGLGLSQVYGFIQQSGGTIQVFSEPEHGTRIVFYIPRYKSSKIETSDEDAVELVKLPTGTETILAVDDEVALLELNEEILQNHGYTVLCATNAEQALEILKSKSVDLLLSDVIMPGMDGYQLAAEVMAIYPGIKIQMVSGFSDENKIKASNEELHKQRLYKPFNSEQLLWRVRDLLDGKINK
ncbi:MAG: hypothetical protein DIZ80_09430 [endosymbiont of Galathealinum brachiosum]|uniref:histidine kinase n=1 Tax=endosymbiont of Galathealinum brachiosum TaxID=2200906 RepID=A0A370DDW6_9GAMM|nr:MAG: hypothetical protein DIZ80_09430 [endosymbiont of Galathealinum brachiosum]